jgi:hypothetical protein
MTELAVRLFMEQPVSEGDILGAGSGERDGSREKSGGNGLGDDHLELRVERTYCGPTEPA